MGSGDLRDFLDRLDTAGELHHVGVEVDPLLEIAEIADRQSKSQGGGKALIFEKVAGASFPTAVNLFGSYRRICLALGCDDLQHMTRKGEEFLASLPPRARAEWWRHIRFQPLPATKIPCREIIDHSPDLESFPFLKSWPEDSGRAATLPLVFTNGPDSGVPNCGIYRVRTLGRDTLAIHWSPGSGGGKHWVRFRERGEPMPVAVVLGGDPALTLAAMLPLPETLDETVFAGFLRGAPVEVVPCLTSRIMVPAEAEVVIEGVVEPDEVISGSLFGNYTGFYAPAPDAAIVRIISVSRRAEPIIPATVVGRPPMEDCWAAKAGERIILPFLRQDLPEVADINLPIEWIFHNSAIVSIKKERPGHARDVITTLRAGRWLGKARALIVVDSDADLHDLSLVAWRVMNFVDWQRDLEIGRDSSDPAAHLPGGGSFIGIDATRKWPEERSGSQWPREIGMDEAVRRLVDARWREYGF